MWSNTSSAGTSGCEELARVSVDPGMRQLMHKYKDLPMDLVDATLVRVAEREVIRRVFTIDRRAFAPCRPAKIGRFQIIP